MRKLIIPLLIILLFSPIAFAQENCVYFFYGNGCPHCANVEPLILELQQKYPEANIQSIEVYTNRDNLLLMNYLFDKYNISQQYRGVPAAFIANEVIIGDTPIIQNLENKILENPNAKCPTEDEQSQTQQTQKINTISTMTVIGAALVDSINPCAIAVLLILLGALLATGDKKKTLKAGLAFTASIYIAYFLFGLGLLSALQITGLAYWFAKIVGILAIIIGLLNIKDFFWYGGGGFVIEIPRRWRPTLKGMLSKVTSPIGAFLIGFVVTLFELPCTGGPYLFILGLLADKTTTTGAIPILLLYNLFFVLPLLIITTLIFLGYSNVDSANKWKEKNIRILHLIAGIIMVALGLVVLLGYA